jgi:hypothetical protein
MSEAASGVLTIPAHASYLLSSMERGWSGGKGFGGENGGFGPGVARHGNCRVSFQGCSPAPSP